MRLDQGKAALAVALLYGTILAFIPLLREVHFLSASLTGLLGAFISAWYAAGTRFRHTPASGLRSCAFMLLLTLLPLLPLLAGSVIRGCFSADGLAYWIIIPAPSVLLGFSLGRYMSYYSRFPRLFALSVLALLAVGLPLWELFNYPQVFFHNHVWGYWPGPIYDDVVELNPSVVFFRYITLSWAALLWILPFFYTHKGVRLPVGLILLSLMLSYLNLSRTGILHSEAYIQQALGGMYEGEHAVIYHDRSMDEQEARWLADLHDFHIQELADLMGLDPAHLPSIYSYIYRHEWQKKKLTGAGNTVYVPVWNPVPQLHIHRPAVEGVLRHELVHVLAREFGMPVINASPNIALVEGLAVALQTERNTEATLHQVVASQDTLPSAAKMGRLMSPTGFYALSGSLSYTLAGSFTFWLLQEYEPERFQQAYRTGSIPKAYNRSFEELVNGWHTFLETVETHPDQLALSDRIFSAPGITEKVCVFHPTPSWRMLQQARLAMAEDMPDQALEDLTEYIENGGDTSQQLLQLWGQLSLRQGEPEPFITQMEEEGSLSELPAGLGLLLADAYFISSRTEQGLALLEPTADREHPGIRIRRDESLRDDFFKLQYTSSTTDAASLKPVLYPYLVRHCLRNQEVDPCLAVGTDLFTLSDYRYYRLYESFAIRLLIEEHTGAANHLLHIMLEAFSDNPLHYAKINRLMELKRLSRVLEDR